MRIVADVQHLAGGQTGQTGCMVEDVRFGFGFAQSRGVDGMRKVGSQTYSVDIRGAVGDGNQGIVLLQKSQQRQGIGEQIDTLSLGMKDFICGWRQVLGLTRLTQQPVYEIGRAHV